MAVLRYLSGFFSFRGRLGRVDFWIFFAVCLAGSVAIGMLLQAGSRIGGFVGTLIHIFILVGMLALTVAFFATGVRRLHDRGYSGWMIVIFYVIPIFINSKWDEERLVVLFRISIGDFEEGWLLRAVASLILIWAFVELFILRGTVGPNKYGADPSDPNSVPINNADA